MKPKEAVVTAILCSVLHMPISFVAVLCLGYHADWYLIPVYPFEVLISSQRHLVAWLFLSIGALRYSAMLFAVMTAKRRLRVVSALVLCQVGTAIAALATR